MTVCSYRLTFAFLSLLTLDALLSLRSVRDLGGSIAGLAGSAQAAEEAPKDMLAAQIRLQGFACDKALGATQDVKRSKPDHTVWVLKCSNASYRISRAPDMAAKVEPLE